MCGRPGLDACTDQDTAHFTCGCRPVAEACDATTLAPLLASPDWHVREDATRRAKDCCVQLEHPAWVDGLGTRVDAIAPPSPEAATRFESIAAACIPTCTAEVGFFPYPPEVQLDSMYGGFYSCDVKRPCRIGFETRAEIVGDAPPFTCSCACNPTPPKPAK